ncbi:MAG: SDR family NAD(P)-dependent oxidoreductase [Paracoccaceae bacterium]|nr:SDR family NAD(P)-dependent oxidoreductase [Paracoccaceae bacterium]
MTAQKTVLITGAGSGIGRALAIEAAKRGHALILCGRRAASLGETAALTEGPTRVVLADVTTPGGRAALEVATRDGLDILINNAGTLSVGHLGDQNDAAIETMVCTNLTAPILLTRDLLPALRARQGRVVNIGSVFGDIAYPFFATYSATKFGLRGFSDALRREMSGQGISVTYIAPRATHTAAETAFGALIGPMQMTLDSPEVVAKQAWNAIARGKRESFPKGKERFFVTVQRLFPRVIDASVGAQARDTRTLAALRPASAP